jgi:hypothetical protein
MRATPIIAHTTAKLCHLGTVTAWEYTAVGDVLSELGVSTILIISKIKATASMISPRIGKFCDILRGSILLTIILKKKMKYKRLY